MTEGFMGRWRRESTERHEQEVADGKHDEQCEFGPRLMSNSFGHTGETFLSMCHCHLRKRIASGFTEPPGLLYHAPPDCTHCGEEVDHDGDNFVCYRCHVMWDPDNFDDPGTFTDNHGDLGSRIKEQP